MNYQAHLALAQPNGHSLSGNLMGDFMKGVDTALLADEIVRGIDNHRAVDKFTDSHPDVLALKPLFSDRYRRFSGIMIDISFDYFLAKHWQQFHKQPHQGFITNCYTQLPKHTDAMPPRMQTAVENMVKQDWLNSYSSFDNIGYALDRVANRLRFKNDFANSGTEVKQHYHAIEDAFLTLYPQLQEHVLELGIES